MATDVLTQVVPETHRDVLAKKSFAHLATIGPRGAPHSHPMWFDVGDDGTILLSTTRARAKLKNLEREPRVAVSILDPDDPYRHVEVRGHVERVEDDPDYEFIDSLARRYLDQPRYPGTQPGDRRVVVHIRPEKANVMG